MNRNTLLSDGIGLRGLADWLIRSCGAAIADLKLVDCGSLDVLLYCSDDLVTTGPGDLEIDRSHR